MDVPRQGAAKRRLVKRIIYGAILLITVPLVTWGLSKMKPAAPSVERATVWVDTVKRGPMKREVRGLGTLVPEEILFIQAANEGRVDKIVLRPGVNVKEDTVLLILGNPELELAATGLEWQVKQAEANLKDLQVKLETNYLDLQASVARVESEFVRAKLQADRDAELGKQGLTPDLTVKLSVATASEAAKRFEIEKKRLAISRESQEAQLAAQQVQISKLRAEWELKKKQVDQLRIRAGAAGVLQQLPVEVGQRVTPGTLLAKVAQPWKLKADLKIAETQAKDIQLGQIAMIDTRNGVIPGKVSRIDPAVINGTRTVDVRLEGDLPPGAVPDLSVDGTIELERLDDVVFVGRPVFGQANSVVGLFKLDPVTKEANRIQVKLGRSSVNTIEVVEGLKVGDQVVLSDMSAWDAHNRIRLN
ncbi:MAG: efflux RND transporter periplasmic adaptor subunit [Bryobacteraceae bacterium]|nr:efflux RND transporter periplasmic adaptor subunit [Bryobacteraceae bacterium]